VSYEKLEAKPLDCWNPFAVDRGRLRRAAIDAAGIVVRLRLRASELNYQPRVLDALDRR